MRVMTPDEVEVFLQEQLRPVMQELERTRAALEIARTKGDHSIFCRVPPPDIMRLSREEQKPWREAHKNCDCWKAQMETMLRSELDYRRGV